MPDVKHVSTTVTRAQYIPSWVTSAVAEQQLQPDAASK
jgi:hypothetical protein